MKIAHYSYYNFPYHYGICGGSLKVAEQFYQAMESLGHTNYKVSSQTPCSLAQFKTDNNVDLCIIHYDFMEHVMPQIHGVAPPILFIQHGPFHYSYPDLFYHKQVRCLIASSTLAQQIAPELLIPFPWAVDTNQFTFFDRKDIDHSITVGFVARLHDNRINMTAAAGLSRYNNKVAGDGPAMGSLQDCGVNCIGALPYEQVNNFLNTLDIFAYPTSMDSFGCVLLEAQANGLPVVAFDVGGVRDALLPGRSGIVVSSEDEFYQAIDNLIINDEMRLAMGASGRKFAESLSETSLPDRLSVIINDII